MAGTRPLGSLLKAFFSGGTPSKTVSAYWAGEIPWASPKDFGPFILGETEDHITQEAVTHSAAKIATKGSVLVVVRSGVLAHTLPVAITGRDMAINQDLKALICKDGISPEFLATYLLTFGDQILPLITKHGVTVQSVNTPEFRALPVPILDSHGQQHIAARYSAAIDTQKQKLAEADALLASINDYLLAELGIALPPEPENTIDKRTQKVSFSAIQQRLDPNFFVRKYVDLTEAIARRPFKLLRDACNLSSETWDQKSGFGETFPYLEISAIDRTTGQITEIAEIPLEEAPSRARMTVRPHDILVSTTRPSRGAIALVSEGHEPFIASTGFAVIREVDARLVDRKFLFHVLRSKIGLTQMEQRSSGGNYPAITAAELKRIKIPLPNLSMQLSIAQEVERMKAAALQLRREANAELEQAKREIEAILLGEAA